MLLTIITFIIILTALVFVHELGHFWIARKSGVKVKEFGIGLPPRIIGLRKNTTHNKWEPVWGKGKNIDDLETGNTVYSLNLFPIGGFVRMKGEDTQERGKDSFQDVSPGKRAGILVAGVTMNYLFAIILLSVAFLIGFPTTLENEKDRAHAQNIHLTVLSVIEESPADYAGLLPGDKLVSVENQTISDVAILQAVLKEQEGREVTVTVQREQLDKTFSITPQQIPNTAIVGLGVGLVETGIISYPVHEAFWQGTRTTVEMTGQIFSALGTVIKKILTTGSVEEQLTGPIGIAVLTGRAVKLGIATLIQFAALLSVNLAILNILPFPALDGGQLLFVIIEKFRGRPVSQKIIQYTNSIGFSLLILLIILVTIRDINIFGEGLVNTVKNFF